MSKTLGGSLLALGFLVLASCRTSPRPPVGKDAEIAKKREHLAALEKMYRDPANDTEQILTGSAINKEQELLNIELGIAAPPLSGDGFPAIPPVRPGMSENEIRVTNLAYHMETIRYYEDLWLASASESDRRELAADLARFREMHEQWLETYRREKGTAYVHSKDMTEFLRRLVEARQGRIQGEKDPSRIEFLQASLLWWQARLR